VGKFIHYFIYGVNCNNYEKVMKCISQARLSTEEPDVKGPVSTSDSDNEIALCISGHTVTPAIFSPLQ